MTKEQKEAFIGNLKSALDTQYRIALHLDASEMIDKQEYDGEDLFNATIIFMHVLGNISIGHSIREGYTGEQMETLAKEMGKSIKQTVFLNTGIDMYALTDRLVNKK